MIDLFVKIFPCQSFCGIQHLLQAHLQTVDSPIGIHSQDVPDKVNNIIEEIFYTYCLSSSLVYSSKNSVHIEVTIGC